VDIESRKKVVVVGAGVTGLTVADYLSDQSCDVTIYSASYGPDSSCCSWWAGGMLALNCELETAEPIIGELGKESMEYWRENAPDFQRNGTLVLATPRDVSLLQDFQHNTQGWAQIDRQTIDALEPEVNDNFLSGLYFEDEAHITPRLALAFLEKKLRNKQVKFTFGHKLTEHQIDVFGRDGWVVDCRGMGARKSRKDLRGVKGEMLHLQSDDISLSRPVRLLHPRIPIYIVPREGGEFMVGASMIESESKDNATVRSVMELLSGAYSVNPAFAEAQIIEIGVDLRPAFADNVPAIHMDGTRVSINGMYRHGYLAAPAMARRARDLICNGIALEELMNENCV